MGASEDAHRQMKAACLHLIRWAFNPEIMWTSEDPATELGHSSRHIKVMTSLEKAKPELVAGAGWMGIQGILLCMWTHRHRQTVSEYGYVVQHKHDRYDLTHLTKTNIHNTGSCGCQN